IFARRRASRRPTAREQGHLARVGARSSAPGGGVEQSEYRLECGPDAEDPEHLVTGGSEQSGPVEHQPGQGTGIVVGGLDARALTRPGRRTADRRPRASRKGQKKGSSYAPIASRQASMRGLISLSFARTSPANRRGPSGCRESGQTRKTPMPSLTGYMPRKKPS